MLILKRKIGESLMIGDDVEITLLERDGDTVKVGICAPRTVRVFRKEIFEEIKLANQSAMHAPGPDALKRLFEQQKDREK
jgi:carbon storage regulator